MSDKQLANDVAKALDRRMRRRKLVGLGAVVGLIALAIFYLTCGRGFGLGGPGKGKGNGEGSGNVVATADAGPRRCTVQVTATGYLLDGAPVPSRADVVTACRATTGADVHVAGDARQGDWDELRTALADAHVPIYLREP